MYSRFLVVFFVALLHMIQTTNGARSYSAVLLGLSNTPVDAECKGDVCKVPSTKSSTGSIKAELVDLESKILKEWKQASGGNDKKLSRAATATVSMTDDAKPTTAGSISTASTSAAVQPPAAVVDVATSSSTTASTTTATIASSGQVSASTAASAAAKTEVQDDPSDMSDKVSELQKMGWQEAEAQTALRRSGHDVGAAAGLLETEEEERKELMAKVKEVVQIGNWNPEAAEAAVRQCQGNTTAAMIMLDNEETAMVAQFDAAVQDMLENGWEEVVARQALLAQWSMDQRKTLGTNTTVPRDILDSIRPSLKRVNDTTPTTNNNKAKGSTATGSSGVKDKAPTPAKKEDCVFEVTSENFQKIVLESPVPVLVDVYADWCGPCKQLGPMLESAAMKSGGMFRLAKVNSDKESSLAQTLEVQGLPTVFACNAGKLTDRFVGMLPQDQLQQFLVRVVTGFGERAQGKDSLSDAQLVEITRKVSFLAGLGSFSSAKKSKLNAMVDAALALEGGIDVASGALSPAVHTALLYIDNASKDVRNPKYRTIKRDSKAFTDKIAAAPAAIKLLDIAGFKRNETSTAGEGDLHLVHSNMAILNLVSQRVAHVSQEKKFARMKNVNAPLGTSTSLRRPKAAATTTADSVDTTVAASTTAASTPPPAKTASASASTSTPSLHKTLAKGAFGDKIAAKQKDSSSSGSSSSKSSSSSRKGSTKTHTLFSTGILDTKKESKKKAATEYFGGDSTVTQAGEEEEEEEEEEEDEEEEEEETGGEGEEGNVADDGGNAAEGEEDE